MCSLEEFPLLPDGQIMPICIVEGRVEYSSPDNDNLDLYTTTVANHPKIVLTRDMLHPCLGQISREVFLPVTETLWKKLQNSWYESGFMGMLRVASQHQNQGNGFNIICFSAQQILQAVQVCSKIYSKIPLLASMDVKSDEAMTAAQGVRAMDWHPHCTKLAVATQDDTVRVYSSHTNLIPLLKCKTQRNVTSLAWRPLSAGDLAVGCEVGAYVWVIDPNSVVVRPSASSATLLRKPNHTNVSSVAWDSEGKYLVSVSKRDRTMYVWEVSTERAVALSCVGGGGGGALASWSPDCTKVFAGTNGIAFRVWDTIEGWTPEKWSLRSGGVVAACWSSCSSVLLFATSAEPIVYALTFGPMASVFNSQGTRSFSSVIDLTAITVPPCDKRVGGDVNKMVWDDKSRYLAISFYHSEVIALFMTQISPTSVHILPRCFIRGTFGEVPVAMSFQKNFKAGANLTIAWSSLRVQYFPIVYSDWSLITSPLITDSRVFSVL